MEAALVLDYKALYEREKAEKEALQITLAALRHDYHNMSSQLLRILWR